MADNQSKRLEGRGETIIDPALPIIDSHHHLWLHPTLPYMLEDYLSDVAAGHNIVASVYVETQAFARKTGPLIMRPIGEIEFANGMAAMSASGALGDCRACAAIVGHADLRLGSELGDYLDRAMEAAPERFRGVRQVLNEYPTEAPYRFFLHRPPKGIMKSAGFIPGLKEVAKRNLAFDVSIFHQQLPELASIADAVPNVTIVLNHMGLAVALDTEGQEREHVYQAWRKDLLELAKRPNVVCKIGGLGLPYWGFGFEERADVIGYEELASAWQPLIEVAIDAFGSDRCMMESNFSADARSCGFVPLWNALKHSVRAVSDSEKSALFYGTASKVYRIEEAP